MFMKEPANETGKKSANKSAKESVTMGKNKTGLKVPVRNAPEMFDNQDDPFKRWAHAADDFHPEIDFQDIKTEYIQESNGVGTLPLPMTVEGVLKGGLQKLTAGHLEVLLDKLGERLAFERSGTRLYEALILKCEAALPGESLDFLRQIRNEELGHFQLLKQAIEDLGADPTAITPCADVTGVQSQGLVQVVNDPRTSVAQSVSAILTAELVDNDGWDLLIKIVQAADMDELAQKFATAREHEARHLTEIRSWIERLTLENEAVALH
jgi:rubrerythrin